MLLSQIEHDFIASKIGNLFITPAKKHGLNVRFIISLEAEIVLIDPTHMTVFEGIRFPTKSTAPSLDGLLTRGEIAEV